MSGLFGPSGGPGRPTFDFSILGDYYLAQAQLRSPVAANTPRPTQAEDVVSFAPWDQKSDATAVSRLRDALGVSSFVDLRDGSFDRPAVDGAHKKLFALYMGLSRLQALATRASEEAAPAGEVNGLNRRFAAGFAEIRGYIADTSFDELTLSFAKRESKADSEFKVVRPPTKYLGRAVVSGAATNAIGGLTGTEVFTVSALKGGATIDVTMNLAEVTGGLSIANVVTYMNGKMEAAGLSTRFSTSVFEGKTASDPKRYGLGVQTILSERISFSATSSSPAIYVAGAAGSGTTQRGQLIKLTDAGSSAAANFTTTIAPSTGTADAKATTVDANGNVYVVGSVTGDLGSGIVQGEQDVYLRKYDAAGQLVWSRLVGSSDRASGFALAADSLGNVAIGGKIRDRLSASATGGGDDTFVMKYDSQGREVFARQVAPVLDDQANALAFGADGSLFVAGQTKSAVASGITHGGGSDAYLMKLTSAGTLAYARQFGSAGDDRATSVAIDGNGDVIIGTVEAGEAKVRKLLAADGVSSAVWEINLGALGQGNLSSVAVDGAAIYVAGSTDNAGLTAGGQASVVAAHGGGADGFLMKITDAGTTANADFITYLGTSANDGANGVAVGGGSVYVTGSTSGAMGGGTAPTRTNGYVAKLDGNGARVWVHQYESEQGAAFARGLSVDVQGASVLDKLGLPRGTIRFEEQRLITATSSVRAGDHFYVKVNGGTSFKVTVSAGDTMRSLVSRINTVLLLKGEATLTRSGGDGLRVGAREGNVVELIAGAGGFDALAGLGLQPGKLDARKDVPDDAPAKERNVFSLELKADAKIDDKTLAKTMAVDLSNAMETIRRAYLAINPAARTQSATNAQAAAAYQNLLAAIGG